MKSQQLPTLQVTEYPTIGSPTVRIHAESAVKLESGIDITSALIDIHNQLEVLLRHQQEQSEALAVLIEEQRSLPWVRLWRWLQERTSWFIR